MKFLLFSALLFVGSSLLAAEARVVRDLAYIEPKTERQTLDVYAPATGTNHPVVVWIHGGGWQRGSKAEMNVKPQAFVDRGYVFIAINYRLIPKVKMQDILVDVARAIRWAQQHAAEYGGDPKTLFVMGHSAGAQLAALICTDDRYLKAEGVPLNLIKGCVPVDGDTFYPALQVETTEVRTGKRPSSYRIKFPEGDDRELSSVLHVAANKGIPAFLILYVADFPESGTGLQAQVLAKSLRDFKIPVQAVAVPGKTHVTLDADLGRPNDTATQVLFQFVEERIKAAR